MAHDIGCVTSGEGTFRAKPMENTGEKPLEPPFASLLRVLAANEARRLLRNAAKPFRAPIEPKSVVDVKDIPEKEN